jgi:CRISPR/Cas system CMR-associated protein Cmr5 small subunit
MAFNGWKNRETWLVGLHFPDWSPEEIKSFLEEEEERLMVEFPFFADWIDLREIDWYELEKHHEEMVEEEKNFIAEKAHKIYSTDGLLATVNFLVEKKEYSHVSPAIEEEIDRLIEDIQSKEEAMEEERDLITSKAYKILLDCGLTDAIDYLEKELEKREDSLYDRNRYIEEAIRQIIKDIDKIYDHREEEEEI